MGVDKWLKGPTSLQLSEFQIAVHSKEFELYWNEIENKYNYIYTGYVKVKVKIQRAKYFFFKKIVFNKLNYVSIALNVSMAW